MKLFFLKFRTVVTLVLAILLVPCVVIAQYPGQHASQITIDTKIPIKAYSFDLQDVTLLDSRIKENVTRNGQWLLGMDINRLLHSWRINAGIVSRAKQLGGWEALDGELRGHTMGHVLSGLALMYASTGDTAYKKRGDSLVIALAECQQIINQDGYLSAFPQNFIDRCINGKPVWAPWYTLHKVMAGLTDMYLYAGNKEALSIVTKMAGWAHHKLNKLTPAQLAVMEKEEFGGMEEVCYNLFAITGNTEDKELAELFSDHVVFDPLARHEDKLAKLHANTQIPKIIGEARGYELTGDDRQRSIAGFFFNTVVAHHTFANGGNSDYEHFFTPGKLSEHLTSRTAETCNTYNMLKLSRHLFSWTADAKYADYYEQAVYNHILAAQDPQSGMASYFMPFKPGLFKVYSTATNSFWCCMGTGFESNAKYDEAIYYHDDKSVYVNLFIPSVLNWKQKGFKLTQHTTYPEEATTRFSVESKGITNMALYIRYPSWAASGAFVKINGKNIRVTQKPGSYILLSRKWQTGDSIEITYPMSLRLVATNDNPHKAAIAYGPIVLAGKMGTEGLTAPVPYANDQNDFGKLTIPADVISVLNTKGNSIESWLKPVPGQPLTFKTNAVASRDIVLEPYYQIHGERYTIYWDLN